MNKGLSWFAWIIPYLLQETVELQTGYGFSHVQGNPLNLGLHLGFPPDEQIPMTAFEALKALVLF